MRASALFNLRVLTFISRALNCAFRKSKSTVYIPEYSMRKVFIGPPLSASSFLSAALAILGKDTRPILVATELY